MEKAELPAEDMCHMGFERTKPPLDTTVPQYYSRSQITRAIPKIPKVSMVSDTYYLPVYGCSTVVLIGFSCPAITVVTGP